MTRTSIRAQRERISPTEDRHAIGRIASELVIEHGPKMMLDAIEFSSNPADAEDAYQRSLVILLTKAPTTDRDELVPWMRTVVRREALAISNRHHQKDVVLDDEFAGSIVDHGQSPERIAESFADLERGAEALGYLSPDQLTCMLAQNDGLEYEEIAARTGFSRRKVSRCLHHGRLAFARKVDEIASGSECERMESLLHRLIDGDADAAIEVRPHLRHCLACRARLRSYETAPQRLAVLVPPVLVASSSKSSGLATRAASWWQAIGERIAPYAIGADRWVEAGVVKKAGIVAVLATATAGTGAVVKQTSEAVRESERRVTPARAVGAARPPQLVDALEVQRPVVRPKSKPKRKAAPVRARSAPSPAPPATAARPSAVDDGSAEFLPETWGAE